MEDVSQVFLEERNGDFVWESFVHQKSHKVKYLKKKYWDSQEKPKLAKLLRISWAKTTEKKDSEVRRQWARSRSSWDAAKSQNWD